jgi:NAD(P)H-hydrate epimerase
MIGALLARGCGAWLSALAAVHLHGLAGDAAARAKGEEAMIAGDLLAELPAVLLALEVARP